MFDIEELTEKTINEVNKSGGRIQLYFKGEVDVEVIGGVSTSERKLVYRIRDIIEELEDKLGKLIPEIDVVSEIKKEYKDISESRIFEALEKLKTSGDIFYPKKNIIQRI